MDVIELLLALEWEYSIPASSYNFPISIANLRPSVRGMSFFSMLFLWSTRLSSPLRLYMLLFNT